MLVLSTLLVALVAGLVFTFAIVTMPGIKKLDDAAFIRAFQVMDGIIQKGSLMFGLVWAGSVAALLIATVLGFRQLEGLPQWLLITATAIYILGVQLPTMAINIPLNNELQTLDVSIMDENALKAARDKFEPRWNRSNVFRSVVAIIVAVLLMIVLVMA
ncbi:MAG: DUF1772 domain-containing protein [Chloroflexota bacterium]